MSYKRKLNSLFSKEYDIRVSARNSYSAAVKALKKLQKKTNSHPNRITLMYNDKMYTYLVIDDRVYVKAGYVAKSMVYDSRSEEYLWKLLNGIGIYKDNLRIEDSELQIHAMLRVIDENLKAIKLQSKIMKSKGTKNLIGNFYLHTDAKGDIQIILYRDYKSIIIPSSVSDYVFSQKAIIKMQAGHLNKNRELNKHIENILNHEISSPVDKLLEIKRLLANNKNVTAYNSDCNGNNNNNSNNSNNNNNTTNNTSPQQMKIDVEPPVGPKKQKSQKALEEDSWLAFDLRE